MKYLRLKETLEWGVPKTFVLREKVIQKLNFNRVICNITDPHVINIIAAELNLAEWKWFPFGDVSMIGLSGLELDTTTESLRPVVLSCEYSGHIPPGKCQGLKFDFNILFALND